MGYVLIVDVELEHCRLLERLLRENGHGSGAVHSGEAALAAANVRPPDLVLLGMRLDGIDGLETLRRLRESSPETPIVLLTAFGTVRAAVEAMRLGANDFISKPFDPLALLETIESLLALRREAVAHAPVLVGGSPAFRHTMSLALQFAVPDINVLLLGETGTGKELFARAIHAASKRRAGPFVAVDCATLAEDLIESELFGHEKGSFTGATGTRIGRFELAQGGTLFLDEIGNLSVPFQAKLLRVLQEHSLERVGGRASIPLDVRVVSATNADMCATLQNGRFRQDLYYRLQGMTIELPPLREREGDVRAIAEHFVRRYATCFGKRIQGISADAFELLERYPWPGNVRELQNTVKSAVVLASDVVRPEHLPPEVQHGAHLAGPPSTVRLRDNEDDEEQLRLEVEIALDAAAIDLKAFGAKAAEQAERALLHALLLRPRMTGGQMARLLGVDPKTLRAKLRRHGLVASLAAAS